MGQAIRTNGPLGRNKVKCSPYATSDEIDAELVLTKLEPFFSGHSQIAQHMPVVREYGILADFVKQVCGFSGPIHMIQIQCRYGIPDEYASRHEKAVEEKRYPQLWRHSKKNSRPRLCSPPRTTGRSRLRNTTLQRIVAPVLSVGCRASDCTPPDASMIELLRGVIPEIPYDHRPICSPFFVLSLHCSDALRIHRRHLRSWKRNQRITAAPKSVSQSRPR